MISKQKAQPTYLDQLRKFVIEFLIEPEKKLFTAAVDSIIEENDRQQGIPTNNFLHENVSYKHSNYLLPVTVVNGVLTAESADRFVIELKRFNTARNDVTRVWQGLYPLYVYSNGNIRDAFPEELVSLFWKNPIRETPQQVFLDKLTPSELRHYNKMLPTMHYYLAMRMVI